MKFIIDENISASIAEAFQALNEPVEHILDHFPRGTLDTEWIPALGERGWSIITSDKHLRTRPEEYQRLCQHKVSVFVIIQPKTKGLSVLGQMRVILRHIEQMKGLVARSEEPVRRELPVRGAMKPFRLKKG